MEPQIAKAMTANDRIGIKRRRLTGLRIWFGRTHRRLNHDSPNYNAEGAMVAATGLADCLAAYLGFTNDDESVEGDGAEVAGLILNHGGENAAAGSDADEPKAGNVAAVAV